MKNRVALLVVLFCMGALLLQGQALRFETLTTRNGLSSNEITCVYEDRQHFLWVGTKDGLNRFDGRRFEVFRNNPNNPNSISGNMISAILQDGSGVMWFGSKDGGITRYDANAPDGKQFTQLRNLPGDSNSIATNRILCLYDWDENYLLIGTEVYSGIFLNKKTLELKYWSLEMKKFHPAVSSRTPQGRLNWIFQVTGDGPHHAIVSFLISGKMIRVNKKTGQYTEIRPYNNMVMSINAFALDKGKMYMCSWAPGLFIQPASAADTVFKVPGINDLMQCVINMNQLYVLAGSRSSGLYRVNKNTGEAVNYRRQIAQPSSLPGNKVNCLYKDSRNIVWVGTSTGLAKYDERNWLFNESEFTGPENDVTILHVRRFNDGAVAVNTSNGMFFSDKFQYQFDSIDFMYEGKRRAPDYLHELADDSVFLLGTEIGLYYWVKGSRKIVEAPVKNSWVPSFSSMGVYQIKEILHDTVNGESGYWMGVLGYGVSFYTDSTNKLYQFSSNKNTPKAIGNNLVTNIHKDRKGNLWVATPAGLYMRKKDTPLSKNEFEAYLNRPGDETSIASSSIMDMWSDEQNHLWVATSGGALCRFNGKTFQQYIPENKISSRIFFSIHPDNRQRLWIITKNGLEIFDLKQKKFFHMDVNDGSINPYISAAGFSNETKGEVSFAGGNRVFTFNPDALKFDERFPAVYLAGMTVFGKSYLNNAQKGVVRLKTSERYINFSLAAIQFSYPGTVHFQYKLQGLKEDWNYSDDGEVKYTSLPWGKFKLLVRVSNPAGHFGNEQVLATFVIATPFYATWWFIVLCIATTAGIVYGIYRYRVNQILALQRVRNKIARDLHDDIGSTLGSISFLSEAAKQQIENNNTAGAGKMLAKIGENSREMVENMSDIVWSVNPKNDTAKFLIDRMRVFAGDLTASSPIRLHYNFDKEVEHVKLTMEQRKNVFLIFKESIYNSVKYADCRNIWVELKKTPGGLVLLTKDDGKGFDPKNYTSKNGNGIKNMELRATEINAVYHIASAPGQGATTTLTIK